jgi:hypothetical protein
MHCGVLQAFLLLNGVQITTIPVSCWRESSQPTHPVFPSTIADEIQSRSSMTTKGPSRNPEPLFIHFRLCVWFQRSSVPTCTVLWISPHCFVQNPEDSNQIKSQSKLKCRQRGVLEPGTLMASQPCTLSATWPSMVAVAERWFLP